MSNLTIWYFLMAALLWSVFYRSTIADDTLAFGMRLGLVLTGLSGLVGLGVPVYGWVPDPITILIVGVGTYMQVLAALAWRYKVPDPFLKPHLYRGNRRATDARRQL